METMVMCAALMLGLMIPLLTLATMLTGFDLRIWERGALYEVGTMAVSALGIGVFGLMHLEGSQASALNLMAQAIFSVLAIGYGLYAASLLWSNPQPRQI